MPALDAVPLPPSGDTSWYDWATALDTDVRGAAELLMDVLGTSGLVAGSNITLTYNDAAGTITIAATGGGGGAVSSVNGHTGVVVLNAADVGALTPAAGDTAYADIDHTHPQVTTGEYNFQVNPAMTDPGSGNFRSNTGVAATATQLSMDTLGAGGTDITTLFHAMRVADTIFVQDKNDASQWVRYQLTALPTINAGYTLVPVTVISSGGTIAGASLCVMQLTLTAGGGGGAALDAEGVLDLLGTTGLVEGAGIDVTYNDAANTITIASTITAPATFTGGTPGLVPDGTAVGATTYLNGNGGWTVPAPSAGGARLTQIFTVPGPLAPAVGTSEFLVTLPGDIVNVWASLTAVGTGASVLVDVNLNGTTIFTTQGNRPTIAAGAQRDTTGTPDAAAADFVAGDRITVDVDQVGTHAAGVQLTIGIEYTYD
jgi:hypothetical protein